MSIRKVLRAVAVFATLAVSCAPLAVAGQGWPWPVDGSRSLGFGATYRAADGSTNVHGGLDIAASTGEPVRACASGEVSFAGKVPAGEGAQAFAVTVLTPDGLRVTLLPLGSVAVSAGATVRAGDAVGALASAGDASSGATHLHLGVKRGSTRLDPESFLANAAAAPPAPPTPATATAPAAVTHAAGVPGVRRPLPGHAEAPVPPPVASPAAVAAAAHASYQEVVTAVADAAVGALGGAPRLRRIPPVSTARVLSLPRLWHDVTDLRGALGKVVLASMLALVSVACAIAVIRSAGESARQAGAALAPIREERS